VPVKWRLGNKLVAVGAVTLALCCWSGLTLAAYRDSPHRLVDQPAETAEWSQIAPEEIAGMGYFKVKGCGSCHNLIQGFPKAGPNLVAAELHHPKQWLVQHLTHPSGPNTAPLSSNLMELNALSLFVANLKPESMTVLQNMSPQYIHGAQVYVTSACSSCHKVNGSGGGLGPALNGLAERRTREWTHEHFAQPAKLSPGSVMPPYRFSSRDEDALLFYLYSLGH